MELVVFIESRADGSVTWFGNFLDSSSNDGSKFIVRQFTINDCHTGSLGLTKVPTLTNQGLPIQVSDFLIA